MKVTIGAYELVAVDIAHKERLEEAFASIAKGKTPQRRADICGQLVIVDLAAIALLSVADRRAHLNAYVTNLPALMAVVGAGKL